jgi:hypothetical protein
MKAILPATVILRSCSICDMRMAGASCSRSQESSNLMSDRFLQAVSRSYSLARYCFSSQSGLIPPRNSAHLQH